MCITAYFDEPPPAPIPPFFVFDVCVPFDEPSFFFRRVPDDVADALRLDFFVGGRRDDVDESSDVTEESALARSDRFMECLISRPPLDVEVSPVSLGIVPYSGRGDTVVDDFFR